MYLFDIVSNNEKLSQKNILRKHAQKSSRISKMFEKKMRRRWEEDEARFFFGT